MKIATHMHVESNDRDEYAVLIGRLRIAQRRLAPGIAAVGKSRR